MFWFFWNLIYRWYTRCIGEFATAPHSARYSGLPQTCSTLDIPRNFWNETIASLCSRTSPVGPVSKRRSWFSWANHCYGWNLGSLIWTKLEMPIRWMETSWFSSSKENVPYTMCCDGDVHCGVLLHHAVQYIQNASYYCMFLQTTFVQHSGENDATWWYRTTSFFMTMQGVTPLLSRTSCASGNGRFWNIHRTHPIWLHAITISSPKWKNHCEGPGTTQEMNFSVL